MFRENSDPWSWLALKLFRLVLLLVFRMQPFLLSLDRPLVFWIILLLIVFFLCWLAMQGSFHPFWGLSQRMGHALLLCPYFRDLTAWKNLIILVAHFNFFLVGFPVFTELFFLKLSILVVDFLVFVAPVRDWIEVHYCHCHRAAIPLWDSESDPAHHSGHKQAVTQWGLVV